MIGLVGMSLYNELFDTLIFSKINNFLAELILFLQYKYFLLFVQFWIIFWKG